MAVGMVSLIKARTTPRVPAMARLANGRRAVSACPDASVNGVTAPTVVPAALVNVMLPAHEAAVPADEFEATLIMLTSAVSPLPRPTGGNADCRVVVCANVVDIPVTSKSDRRILRLDMVHLSF